MANLYAEQLVYLSCVLGRVPRHECRVSASIWLTYMPSNKQVGFKLNFQEN